MFHREIHQRFDVGRAPSVCPVKGYVFAEFFFEAFPFLVQEIAKDDRPSWTKRLTMPAPIPLAPPVTTAT